MRFPYAIAFFSLIAGGCLSTEPPAPIDIGMSSIPALPVSNMLPNAGFENGLPPWRSQADGVELSEESSPGGGRSVLVRLDKRESGKTKTFYCSAGNLKSPLRPGQSYIVSGWMKAGKGLDNSGGLHHGAGFSLSVYDGEWKRSDTCRALSYGDGKWKRLVSAPFVAPEWVRNMEFHAGIFYACGAASLNHPTLAEAYVKLNFCVKSRDLLQVLVEDDTGRVVFDSGELPPGVDELLKSVDVLSVYGYSVRALNRSGGVAAKSYPQTGRD